MFPPCSTTPENRRSARLPTPPLYRQSGTDYVRVICKEGSATGGGERDGILPAAARRSGHRRRGRAGALLDHPSAVAAGAGPPRPVSRALPGAAHRRGPRRRLTGRADPPGGHQTQPPPPRPAGLDRSPVRLARGWTPVPSAPRAQDSSRLHRQGGYRNQTTLPPCRGPAKMRPTLSASAWPARFFPFESPALNQRALHPNASSTAVIGRFITRPWACRRST